MKQAVQHGRWSLVQAIRWVRVLTALLLALGGYSTRAIAQVCSPPVLDRLGIHTVGEGESLSAIADRYDISIFTLIEFNPGLHANTTPLSGSTLVVAPYNGFVIASTAGNTWRDLADRYNVRADTLFELNGCGAVPATVFIPGATRSPIAPPARATVATRNATPNAVIDRYPLTAPTETIVRYGWVLLPNFDHVTFHSGVDLVAEVGDTVQAAGDGTVAFAGDRAPYGTLIVINHARGRQTRYAHLGSATVSAGQQVSAGEAIGAVGQTGRPDVALTHLHFELRYSSDLGWIADDPQPLLDAMSETSPTRASGTERTGRVF